MGGRLRGSRRAVFLDRDGVLNRAIIRAGKPYPPSSLAELEVLPEASAALMQLKRAGLALIVVTNQPDVSRGTQTVAAVEAMHSHLRNVLPLDDILVCYHDDHDGCNCRKPQPGLLLEAARRYDVQLASSFMVGDRWRDIDAGLNAGVRTVLIDFGYGERQPTRPPAARVASLSEAAEWIIRQID